MTDKLRQKIDTTRIRDSQDAATVENRSAKATERPRRERIRREHAAQWYEFEMLLAENHRQLSEEHEVRARALREGGMGGSIDA